MSRTIVYSDAAERFHKECHEDWDTLCGPDCSVLIAFSAEWEAGFRSGGMTLQRALRRRLALLPTWTGHPIASVQRAAVEDLIAVGLTSEEGAQ